MKYVIQIHEVTDSKGSTHRKCVVTLPYKDLVRAKMVRTKKARTVEVEYDNKSKQFTIKKAK